VAVGPPRIDRPLFVAQNLAVNRAYGVAFVVLLVFGGGLVWWQHQRSAREVAETPKPAVAPAPPAPAPPPAPAVRHPLPAAPAGGLPALDRSDSYLQNALADLLGRQQLRAFLHLDGVVRRFVATVNNLAADDASASLWPVKTTEGGFETEPRDGGMAIGVRNGDRYVPFVRFVEGIDPRRAVALYLRVYPLLQQAYEDLGYPGKYFNDRVVEVIDNLLATPSPAGPIAVKRFAAEGGPPGGGLYVYVDPALEAGSAGQKILLRMGRDNAAALMAKLRELRAQIAARPPSEQ
jgi:Protein of unknown function (DUF3014)